MTFIQGFLMGYQSAIRDIKRELDNAWNDNDRLYIIQRILKGVENEKTETVV